MPEASAGGFNRAGSYAVDVMVHSFEHRRLQLFALRKSQKHTRIVRETGHSPIDLGLGDEHTGFPQTLENLDVFLQKLGN